MARIRKRDTVRIVLNYFLQGLLFTVPVAVTLYVLFQTIAWIDNLFPWKIPVPGTTYQIPGTGLIAIFILVTTIGFFGTRYIRNPFFQYFEKLIDRAPLAKLIYSSVKDLISAFVGEKKSFNHPVLVQVDKDLDIQRIGFITKDDLTDLGLSADKVAVYLPFSYGFNGQLFIVPKTNIKMLDSSGTDMMKFIISGGVTEIRD